MRTLVLALILASVAPVAAQPVPPEAGTGLPLPRFASLRAGEANMRTGPGDQYPISWTYKRRGLPIEIVKEWGIWRQVRDPDGTTGWMNKALLDGERTGFVRGAVRPLHAEPDVKSRIVWRAESGVVGRLLFCAGAWCRMNVDGRSGYILREHIWGVYRTETIG